MDEIQWQPINTASYLLAVSVNNPGHHKAHRLRYFLPHFCGEVSRQSTTHSSYLGAILDKVSKPLVPEANSSANRSYGSSTNLRELIWYKNYVHFLDFPSLTIIASATIIEADLCDSILCDLILYNNLHWNTVVKAEWVLRPYDTSYQHLFNIKRNVSSLEVNLRQSSNGDRWAIKTELCHMRWQWKRWQPSSSKDLRQTVVAVIKGGCMMGQHSGMMKDTTSHPNDPHQQLSAMHH